MAIENIIVQAGGKGTRLEHLTYNKPKCIVSVNNLPILFYAFQKFPNANFRVIADYKSDVLEKYLEVNAKQYKYQIIKTSGEGTASGIKDAIATIGDNTPFMLMWSDLILSNDFELPAGGENYIGISKDFECRWSYIDGQCVKIPSKENGIAGLFVFKDRKLLADVPEEGEFVRWLSTQNIPFERLNLYGSKEIGTMISYNENTSNRAKCRPFNSIKFMDNTVIKTAINEFGKEIAKNEIAWYRKINELVSENCGGGSIY